MARERRPHWSSLVTVIDRSPFLVSYRPVGPLRLMLPVRSGSPSAIASSRFSMNIIDTRVSIMETSRYCPWPVRSFSRSAARME